jgi:hypothetical protein
VRTTGVNPSTAEVAEVVYYFHKWYKTLPAGSEELELHEGTHPVVYVGGQPHQWIANNFETSGGSYWKAGIFRRVGALESVTECVIDGEDSFVCEPEDFKITWIGKTAENPEKWWLEFPGRWGRPKEKLKTTYPESPFGEAAPPGPWYHDCWESYQHPKYHEYTYNVVFQYPAPGAAEQP